MWQDPIVAEVRQIREAYAAQFNFDLAASAMKNTDRPQHDREGRLGCCGW